MSNSASDRNLNIDGSADGSVVVVGDGNIINSLSSIPTSAPNPFGVPYQRNRYFTGREAVLTQLHEQLTQSTATAITQIQAISGLGGIGKTQTAVEYAYRYYYDESAYTYVLWVTADTESNLSTDFGELSTQLCLPESQGTEQEKIPAMQRWLATHNNWLLIFDNTDTLDWLANYLPTNPKGKVLITSRARIFDEVGIDTPLLLNVLSLDESVELLIRRTKAKNTAANIAAAMELNQSLDGLPLALEQASAFIVRKGISLSTYLKAYRKQPLSQLEKTKAKTGRYPSSVLKTWRLNFEAVAVENNNASKLLQLSSFFAPTDIPYRILITGAEYLDNSLSHDLQRKDEDETRLAVGELLDLLSQYSLVRWEPEKERYSLHRLVQSVVRSAMSTASQSSLREQAILVVESAYPGSEFNQWPICVQLLPHWLQISKEAEQAEARSKALGRLYNQAALYLDAQGRYGEAESLYRKALVVREQLLGDEHPDVATSLNNLALLYQKQGRYSEAESICMTALSMRKQLLGDEHPDVATSLNNLALLYQKQRRYSEAEPLYEAALSMRKRLLGDEHTDVALSLNNLAVLYNNQGRYSDAEPLYEAALSMRKRLLGNQHPDVALSLNNLAVLYKRQERYSEAEALYEVALSMRKQLLGEEHPYVAASLYNLALLYYRQGRYNEANLLCTEALSMRKRLLGEEHPSVSRSLNTLAEIYVEQGRYCDAKPLYAKALSMSQRLLGDDHPRTKIIQDNYQSFLDEEKCLD